MLAPPALFFDEFSGLDLSVETVKIIYYKVIFKVGAPLHVPSLAALHCIILHFFLPTNRLRVVAWFAVFKTKGNKKQLM